MAYGRRRVRCLFAASTSRAWPRGSSPLARNLQTRGGEVPCGPMRSQAACVVGWGPAEFGKLCTALPYDCGSDAQGLDHNPAASAIRTITPGPGPVPGLGALHAAADPRVLDGPCRTPTRPRWCVATSSCAGMRRLFLANSGGPVMTMTALPYDPEHPPEQPPTGADFMTWMLAYRIHAEHQPGPEGFCLAGSCRAASNLWPCEPSKLARSGFRDACWPIIKRRQASQTGTWFRRSVNHP